MLILPTALELFGGLWSINTAGKQGNKEFSHVTYTSEINNLYKLPMIRNFKCVIMDNYKNSNNFQQLGLINHFASIHQNRTVSAINSRQVQVSFYIQYMTTCSLVFNLDLSRFLPPLDFLASFEQISKTHTGLEARCFLSATPYAL